MQGGLVFIGIASALINILYLTSSFFMLEVYDRVIPSKSIPSLAALAILALMLYAFQGAFEVLRSRMLVRVAGSLDEMVNGRVFRALIKAPLKVKIGGDGLQPLRDFDQIRTLPVRYGPDGDVRSAVVAVLYRDLLPVPSGDRIYRDRWIAGSRHPDIHDQSGNAYALEKAV
ncbi:hypothetical protein ACOJBO_27685 [Rhizobium beringeri]